MFVTFGGFNYNNFFPHGEQSYICGLLWLLPLERARRDKCICFPQLLKCCLLLINKHEDSSKIPGLCSNFFSEAQLSSQIRGHLFFFSESGKQEGNQGGKSLYHALGFQPEIPQGSTSVSSRYPDHLWTQCIMARLERRKQEMKIWWENLAAKAFLALLCADPISVRSSCWLCLKFNLYRPKPV